MEGKPSFEPLSEGRGKKGRKTLKVVQSGGRWPFSSIF